MEFKSDWKFQVEVLKRILKYHRLLKYIILAEVAILYPICFYLAYHNYLKYGPFYGIFWIIYPFFITMVPIIPHLTPKTYKTHLRGIFINGHLWRWKNFSSYFTDGKYLYLLRRFRKRESIALVLPKEFEDVVKEFVKKREDYDRDGDREVQQVSQSRS